MTRSSSTHLLKKFGLTILLIFFLSACDFSLPLASQAPVVQTVQVTQVVTQLVTQEITQEVTRVVEIPVTVTPSETPVYTYTPSETLTMGPPPTSGPTLEPPMVAALDRSDCLWGAGDDYLYKTTVKTDGQLQAVGRNPDGTWTYVQETNGWNPCWIKTSLVKFVTGDIKDVPVIWTTLPYSAFYTPPKWVIATRSGTDVTISWPAVTMSSDDYRGYMIEAWLCQSGTLMFFPIGHVKTPDKNKGLLSITVSDESGCSVPSSARIYTVDKHGYSVWLKIPWPQLSAPPPVPTSTPLPTSTPTP